MVLEQEQVRDLLGLMIPMDRQHRFRRFHSKALMTYTEEEEQPPNRVHQACTTQLSKVHLNNPALVSSP